MILNIQKFLFFIFIESKMKFNKINIISLIFMSILFRVSSIKGSDESSSHETQSKTSKCIAYVDKYGFLKEEKSCNKYCCGGCQNRYCCSTKKEAIKNQLKCMNNFNSSNIGLGPVKHKICLAYLDNNDKLLPEKTCENGYFCSGTCSRRFCGNKDYDWLDQIKCRNGFNSTNTTAITTTKFGHLKVDKLFYFIGFGLATFGFLLIAYKLITNLFEKEMKINSKCENMEVSVIKKYENDKPPPYPGY